MENGAKVTVLIATNRENYRRTVGAIVKGWRLTTSLEIMVIRNGCREEERALRLNSAITMVLLTEPVAGKSNALNRGMAEAHGELLLFTDDDAVPSGRWAEKYYQAALAYPEEACFCGPIYPVYPREAPDWIPNHRYAGILYACFAPRATEGTLAAGVLPFGPNFAVRKQAVRNLKFRLGLGPSAVNGALLGEDVDFTAIVRDRVCITTESRGFRYLPECAVTHIITPDRLDFAWMMERFFQLGRSRVIRFDRSSHISYRPALLHPINVSEPERAVIEGGELNFYYGQYYQCLMQGKPDRADYFKGILALMKFEEHPHYFSASMAAHVTQTRNQLALEKSATTARMQPQYG